MIAQSHLAKLEHAAIPENATKLIDQADALTIAAQNGMAVESGCSGCRGRTCF